MSEIQTEAVGEAEIARYTRRRPRRKKVLIAVLLAAGAIIWAVRPKETIPTVETQTLTRGGLVRQVGLSGTIESAGSARVYSTQTAPVKAVYVKAGDVVQAGELLAELDSTDIELSIAEQKATMSAAAQLEALTLADAQRSVDGMVQDMQNGTYAPLVLAQQNVALASKNLAEARRQYSDNEDEIEYADDQVNKMERTLAAARRDRTLAVEECRKADGAGHATYHTESCLAAQRAYDDTFAVWRESYNEYSTEISSYSKAVQDARLSYENALQNQELAEQEAQRTLEGLRSALEKSRLSADSSADVLTLSALQRSLDKCMVTSPVSGTVTAVYAVEGMPGGGLLFVVEDVENLIVKTAVREYDVGAVEAGMPAVIKTDATGDAEFEGEVLHVAPAARKDASGETASGSVEFETDVALRDAGSGLRIGMNARLNIILEEKQGVFSVPYDAVVTDAQGRDVIYLARGEGSSAVVETVPVTLGMENDFSVEVISAVIDEGDRVILSPAQVADGMTVTVPGAQQEAAR